MTWYGETSTDIELVDKPLSEQEYRFAIAFSGHFNKKRAAKEAGYSDPRDYLVIANALLEDQRVQAVIQEQCININQRYRINGQMVLMELARIAFADVTDVVEWEHVNADDDFDSDPDGPGHTLQGVRFKASKDIPPHARAAIADITTSTTHGITIKMHDKMKALEILMKHAGMLDDVVYHRMVAGDERGQPPAEEKPVELGQETINNTLAKLEALRA